MNQKVSNSPLHDLIRRVTDAHPTIVPIIERLMRDDIFHSTLDWQTAEELEEGARQAYSLYQLAPPYFNTVAAHQTALFRSAKAKAALEKAQRRSDAQAVSRAEQRAKLCERKERELATMCLRLGEAFFGQRA